MAGNLARFVTIKGSAIKLQQPKFINTADYKQFKLLTSTRTRNALSEPLYQPKRYGSQYNSSKMYNIPLTELGNTRDHTLKDNTADIIGPTISYNPLNANFWLQNRLWIYALIAYWWWFVWNSEKVPEDYQDEDRFLELSPNVWFLSYKYNLRSLFTPFSCSSNMFIVKVVDKDGSLAYVIYNPIPLTPQVF
jgi:hypothetical protein